MEDNILKKVERLLTLASHPGTHAAEAQDAREKADTLMIQYKTERATLNLNRNEKEVKKNIVERQFTDLNLVDSDTITGQRDWAEYRTSGTIQGIRRNVFRHAGCHIWGSKLVGYEPDVLYAEFLWLCIYQEVVSLLYPKWNKEIGFDENVYNLKKAGYSWPQVREVGLANEAKDKLGPLTHKNAGSKLRSGFKRHANSIGEEVLPGKQQPISPSLWRESFAQSFATRMAQRFAAMEIKREEYVSSQNLPAMVRDEDLLRQEFYERCPNANPDNWPEPPASSEKPKKKGRAVKVKTRAADMNAWNAGYAAASKVNLSRDSKIQNKKELG